MLRFTLLVLKTKQLERVTAFYRSLGLSLSEEKHGKGPIHFAGQVGEIVLEIYPLAENVSADSTTRLGLALDDLEQALSSVAALDAPILEPARMTPWGQRAVVQDPDGRSVELYQSQ